MSTINITNSSQFEFEIEYDDEGNIISTKNYEDEYTYYEHNEYQDYLDRITSSTNEEGEETTYSYDENGNLVEMTDPGNNSTHYTYDELNRLIKLTNANNKETEFAYGDNSNLTQITNPLDKVTTMLYDDGTYDSFRKGLGIDYGGFIWATCGGWLTREILKDQGGGGDKEIVVGKDDDGNDITMTMDDFVAENISGYSNWDSWCLDYAISDIINWSMKKGGKQGGGNYEYNKRQLTIPYLVYDQASSLYTPAGVVQMTQINMAESFLINTNDVFESGYHNDGAAAGSVLLSALAIAAGIPTLGLALGIGVGLSIGAIVIGFLKGKNPDLLTNDMLTQVINSMGWKHIMETDWYNNGFGGGGSIMWARWFYSSGKGQVMAHSRYKMLVMRECITSRKIPMLGHIGAASALYLGNLIKNNGDATSTAFASLLCAGIGGEDNPLVLANIQNSKWNVDVWASNIYNPWRVPGWGTGALEVDIPIGKDPYGEKPTSNYGGSSTMSGGTSGTSSNQGSGTSIPVFPEQSGIQIGFTSSQYRLVIDLY